ncbi:MAG: ArnT family glycosyltransferase, partial [Pirellulales bacterium]
MPYRIAGRDFAPRISQSSQQRTGLGWRALLCLALYAASLDLVALGSRTLNYHEVLYAQPAREMLASGDWIQPRLIGVPCNQKPPLTTWLIAASMALWGDSEWAVRLPSVLASAWLAAVVAGLAARWLGRRAGLAAGLVQATSFYVLRQARTAEADIFLCLAVALAMSCFSIGVVDGTRATFTRRWLPAGFYLAAGLAFLVKGPIGPGFILAACGLFAVVERRRAVWRFLFDPLGLALVTLCVVAWPLAAYAADPTILDDWRLHHLGRFSGELGRKSGFYYLYTMPAVLLPWTPAAAVGIWLAARRGWWRTPQARLLACWILPGLLVISMCAFKRKHYSAPLLPPMSLAASLGLVMLLGHRWKRLPWQAATFAAV